MTEQELDRFLREPSGAEKFFRTHDNLNETFDQNSIDMEEIQELLRNQDKKMPPFHPESPSGHRTSPAESDLFDENHLMPPGQSISFSMHPRYNATQRHHHSYIELIYVYSGECNQTINNNKITMRKGEICILDTNTSHSIEKTGDDDIIVNCLMRKNYFNAAFLSRLSGNDIFTDFFVRSIYQSKDFHEYILLHSGDNEKISQLMKNILCEYFDKSMCSDEVIDSCMIILFAEMLRVYKNDINLQNYSALKNTQISEVIKYVQSNYKTATLESTAKHFNFDAGYLSKAIKKLTGNKFMDLVHQARLGQACLLLKSTDVPVNTVANETGYENISFFYQIFKRHFNCSPADYRKIQLTARKPCENLTGGNT